MQGLYGHSSRRAAESCPAILVGVNEWQLWQSKTCLTQRGRANGGNTRGVTVIRQPTGRQDGAAAQNAAGAGFGQAALSTEQLPRLA